MSTEYQSDRFLRRFWSKVSIKGVDDCWEWTAARNLNGYGQLFRTISPRGAHRISYELANGPVPEGLEVMHTCDNRVCCNPRHLKVGTHQENVADCVAKGRQTRGEMVGKLVEDEVRAIRMFLATGSRSIDMARLYGVSDVSVARIKHEQTWRHIL